MHPYEVNYMKTLYQHQKDAVEELKNGKILWGGVGSGKSRTALAYYMKYEAPVDLYIITTAKKRDSLEWDGEAVRFGIGTRADATIAGVLVVDSWNNIGKYTNVSNAFFIFDEQRLVGFGSWTKAFYKIVSRNRWILLSATPGDTWMDYIPVFIANGYYKNRTEFIREHVIYNSYTKYPKIDRYINVGRLRRHREELLVHMPYKSKAKSKTEKVLVDYDTSAYSSVLKDRWNKYADKPITSVSELYLALRRVANTDPSRLLAIRELLNVHEKLIIFYTFNYELDILRQLSDTVFVGEWNGHKHDPIPKCDRWVYLVQYGSGSEGWNCTETNAICFYSLTYSYKMFKQACGRIDRLDTPYDELYYYVLTSTSSLDVAISKALTSKKNFVERAL
jgi:superfamily II DNA or RNA helicase